MCDFFSAQCAISSSTKRRWMYLCSPSRPHTLTLEVVKEVNSSSSCLLVYWKIAGIPDKTSHFYGCDQRYEWLGSSYTILLKIRFTRIPIHSHLLLTTQNLHHDLWCQMSSRESNLGVLNVWLHFGFCNKQADRKDPVFLIKGQTILFRDLLTFSTLIFDKHFQIGCYASMLVYLGVQTKNTCGSYYIRENQ